MEGKQASGPGIYSLQEIQFLRVIVRAALRKGNIGPDSEQAESMARRVLDAYAHGIRRNAALFDVATQILSSPERPFPPDPGDAL